MSSRSDRRPAAVPAVSSHRSVIIGDQRSFIISRAEKGYDSRMDGAIEVKGHSIRSFIRSLLLTFVGITPLRHTLGVFIIQDRLFPPTAGSEERNEEFSSLDDRGPE